MWFYDNFRTVCAQKGTTITQALRAIHRPTSLTGGWSSDRYPRLDVVIELADYLGVTLDELVYARAPSAESGPAALSAEEQLWLSVISQIPVEKHSICLDFLETHIATPKNIKASRQA